jgi:lysozyme
LHLCNYNHYSKLAKQKVVSKKSSNSVLSKIFIVFSIGFIGLLGYQWWKNGQSQFVRYKEFGIDIPINYSMHGIDVSHHNGLIDWQEVKAMNVKGITIQFSFIKATQGVTMEDPQFPRNWKQSRKFGITRGAYHFFNEFKPGKEQAEHYIATLGDLLPGDLPPVLDIEENRGVAKEILIKEALIWLQIVESHYKIKPIIYTFVNFYENQLGSAFDGYPFWAAHYNEKQQPRTDRSWSIWQHNEKGHVNGISTNVDFNVFKGDIFEFKRLLVSR